jgi:hypothetical protein
MFTKEKNTQILKNIVDIHINNDDLNKLTSERARERKTVSFMLDPPINLCSAMKRSGISEKEAGHSVSQNNRKSMKSLIMDIENEFKQQYKTIELDHRH